MSDNMTDATSELIRTVHQLTEKGLHREAIVAASKAREDVGRRLGQNHTAYAALVSTLGVLHHKIGDYSAAAHLLQDAVKLFREMPQRSNRDYALSLTNLAAFYESIGHYLAAEPLNQEALRIQCELLGETHPDCGITLNNLAIVYQLTGKLDAAESLYCEALDIKCATLGENHVSCAGVLNNLGELYGRMGRYERAEKFYKKAADNLTLNGKCESPEYAQTLNNTALLYKCLGDYELSEPLYLRALSIWRASFGEDHSEVAEGIFNLTALYAATDRVEEALVFMDQGLAIEDRTVGQILSVCAESQILSYLESVHNNLFAYITLFSTHALNSRDAVRKAFRLVLRRKGIAAEVLAVRRETVLSGRYPALEPKLRELTELRRRVAQLVLAKTELDELREHRRGVDSLNSRSERLEEELARQIPEMNFELELRGASLQAIAQRLPQGSVLVEFIRFNVFNFKGIIGDLCRLPPRYLAFVVIASTVDDVQAIDLGEAEPIDGLIAEFRASITGEPEHDANRDMLKAKALFVPTDMDRVGRELRAALFDPLVPALLRRKRLFLAPDGDLARLPFEVLPTDDGRRLIDDYCISYVGCGRDVLRFQANSTGQPGEPVIVADPDFDLRSDGKRASIETDATRSRQSRDLTQNDLSFERLPGTRVEGERIAQLLKVRPWLQTDVLEQRLKQVRSPWILHLATHGFFLEDQKRDPQQDFGWTASSDMGRFSGLRLENPLLRSGLALAGGNTWLQKGQLPPEAGDGLLTAEDVTGMDLLDTELVVLSACNTGLGEIRTGEGVFGLRRAFVLAGAKTLVMSLWKVPDEETRELMEDFYRRILAGEPRAEALRNAQLAMKAKYPHPFFWGAFICQGNPGPLPPRRRWYYSLDGKQPHGPVDDAELKDLVRTGQLTKSAKVSLDCKKWQEASQLKGIKWPDC